jgi:hypothetical protein
MTKLIRWHYNRVSQERPGLARPAWRATRARSITQIRRIRAGRVAGEPVIHALSANLQQRSNLGHGAAASAQQQGQDAPVEPDIIGLSQLVFELLYLRWRKPLTAHGYVPPVQEDTTNPQCVKLLLRTCLGRCVQNVRAAL